MPEITANTDVSVDISVYCGTCGKDYVKKFFNNKKRIGSEVYMKLQHKRK